MARAREAVIRIEFQRLRFLVVDDNAYMRRIIRALLHGFGAREVYEAADGAEGLEGIVAFKPDIVITDWEMPILDGIEMTRHIRQPNSGANPFVPIIMVSAYSEKARVLAARDAGVNEFLVKPISARSLYERVLSVVAYPRPFIRSKEYFGPDRRRGGSAPHSGSDRRQGGDHEVLAPPSPGAASGAR